MKIVVNLNGKTYVRNYEWRFCALPGCGKRIAFRVNAKGDPEGSDKHNKRQTCRLEHARQLQAMRVKETIKAKTQGTVNRSRHLSSIDRWLLGVARG